MHLLLAVLPAGSRGRGLRRQSFSSPAGNRSAQPGPRTAALQEGACSWGATPRGRPSLRLGWLVTFVLDERRLDARGFFPAVPLGHPSTL